MKDHLSKRDCEVMKYLSVYQKGVVHVVMVCFWISYALIFSDTDIVFAFVAWKLRKGVGLTLG